MKKKSTLSLITALLITACVTINIYFPAAAAEKVADEIIKDIQKPAMEKHPPETKNNHRPLSLLHWADDLLNIIIPPAQAGMANLSIDTAEIRNIRARMQQRFPTLQHYYSNGYIGIAADGFLVVRNVASIPPPERGKVKKYVAAENNDRRQLYKAIALANGHPDWFEDIRTTFARRWISNAQPGWWYQTANGTWQQK